MDVDGPLHGRRILVVEDEVLIGMLIESIVDDNGGVVVGPAHRLGDALATARREPIDAAILDVNLAGTSSYAVADVLRARNIPIVFLSGYGASALKTPYSGHPFVQKPFAEPELIETLQRCLHGQQAGMVLLD
jgi:CheY-like chemotaxis protein